MIVISCFFWVLGLGYVCLCAFAQAWNDVKVRFKVFSSIPDTETGKQVSDAIEQAKVTMIEYNMLQGVLTDFVKDGHKSAVASIIAATKSMTSVKPPVSSEALHPTLWKACHAVLAATKVI